MPEPRGQNQMKFCQQMPVSRGAKVGFYAQFPEKLGSQNLHINALELVTIMVAVRLWVLLFHGRRMTIICNNASSVEVLNKEITKDESQANCLRETAFIASKYEFSTRANIYQVWKTGFRFIVEMGVYHSGGTKIPGINGGL